ARRRAARVRRQRPADPGRRPVIVDSLTFVGPSIFGGTTGTPDVLAALDASGADRAIVCPAKPPGYHLGSANDAVAEAAASGEGRLTGLARVDPLLGDDACRELERAVDELGLRGLFLHPWQETFPVTDRRVDAVVEVARSRGVPVVVAA